MDANGMGSGSTAYRRMRLNHWPQRSRRLLQELFEVTAQWLHTPVQGGLDTFVAHLFECAKNTRNSVDQRAYLNSRDHVMQQRGAFEQHVLAALADQVERAGQPDADAADPAPVNVPLSLVNPRQQETSAALESISVRGTARGGLQLVEVGYRMAALFAKPPLEGVTQPFGPHALAHVLHTSITALDLSEGLDVVLLKHFERVFNRELWALYAQLNAHLASDGLLPNLRAFGVMPSAQATANATEDDKPETPATQQAAPGAPSKRGRRATDGMIDSGDAAFVRFEDLRRLLAEYRPTPPSQPVGTRIASADELQSALGGLQHYPDKKTRQPGRELGSAKHLRDELLSQINSTRSDTSETATFSAEQNDTLELVCMLFEQLNKQIRKGSNAHNILGGLQVPLLRMAVSDHDFFEQSEHPARHLLGTVTRAANEWLDTADGDSDRGLEAKLQDLIDRANCEPPSAGLYTSLLADIEQHLSMLKLRAQASERRQVEGMEGRERLERARQRACDLMAERFAVSEPHGLLRALLDRAWTDVLALTLLRHGETSPHVGAQLKITDQLLGRIEVSDRKQLQVEVQTGLTQIGMAALEAEQVAERLVAGGDAAKRADAPSSTEMLLRLKRQQRLGESTSTRRPQPEPQTTPAPSHSAPSAATTSTGKPLAARPSVSKSADSKPVARAVAGQLPTDAAHSSADTAAQAPVDPRVATIETSLRELPFGTWFEFADDDSRNWVPRKLAWYSPMSHQALFVNRRGQQGKEMKLRDVAQAMVLGHIRQMRANDDRLLDRAWSKLMVMLRQDAAASSTSTETH